MPSVCMNWDIHTNIINVEINLHLQGLYSKMHNSIKFCIEAKKLKSSLVFNSSTILYNY